MSERVLLDTGPLVALLSESDSEHQRCAAVFKRITAPLLTCWPVLTEAAWLLRKQPRPLDLISKAHAGGIFKILTVDGEELDQIAAVMRRYEDAGIQLADATLAYLADREGIRTVFTTDRRDFSLIRLKRNRSLRIIPDLQ